MPFSSKISQADLASGQSEADRARHGRTFSATTGGWTEPATEKPVAGTGTTDQDSTGARKWWGR
ncbi:hypothetical protein [Streptomyces sp. NPDC051577]|uniref:hypothetical protein n=1 Tax=Streptomyces sp. NPDC051577 TaxID=3155166 RepID=UPI003425B68A